eukprot:scaffold9514_cov60-Cyclotella_meneghiniana.AAC.2
MGSPQLAAPDQPQEDEDEDDLPFSQPPEILTHIMPSWGWPPLYGVSLSASFHSLDLVVAKHPTLKASNIELRGITSMITGNQSDGVKMGECDNQHNGTSLNNQSEGE